ncbi:hypothetical protein ADL00_02670 [Streptomyces sp. AS58]|uniref:hypothetical protein n=1 Tax=Streptomyces sp. AS58 TaxID=1519489 RepID=UPI0006C466B8|nr:hypothetical protein [Streptomyces sp. AS58]KOV74256.1 hypothetical protein ADL00_02670 [Streptomyces sp. AS58]
MTRLAWLAMLLFGLLFAHGLHGESASGHLTAGVITSLPTSDANSSTEHDQPHRDGSETSAHTCAPGQPDDSFPVPFPGRSPMADDCHLPPHVSWRVVPAYADIRPPSTMTVLRI